MGNAPSLEDIESSTPKGSVHSNYEQKFPSVQLIGAGGAGINVIRSFLKENRQFDEEVKVSVIDTSLSNLNGLDSEIQFFGIGGLGSGKDRAKNFNVIKEYLDTHTELTKDAADITVLVFALGGGSGSVIAPLLAQKMLHNTNKGVLLVGIVDQSSERDCINSINTLKTLSGIAKEYNLYFPILLFSNKLAGRFAVNKSIVNRINQFIGLMTDRSIEEFDYTDKMNFMRAIQMNCPSGLYLFSITNRDDVESKGEINVKTTANSQVHAIVVVDDVGDAPGIMSMVSYFGYSESKTYTAVTGLSIPAELLQDLKENQERYRDAVSAKDSTEDQLKLDDAHKPNAGIVL